jgi:hypothetical protein
MNSKGCNSNADLKEIDSLAQLLALSSLKLPSPPRYDASAFWTRILPDGVAFSACRFGFFTRKTWHQSQTQGHTSSTVRSWRLFLSHCSLSALFMANTGADLLDVEKWLHPRHAENPVSSWSSAWHFSLFCFLLHRVCFVIKQFLGSISLTVPGVQGKILIIADSRIYGLQTLASVNGAVLDFSVIWIHLSSDSRMPSQTSVHHTHPSHIHLSLIQVVQKSQLFFLVIGSAARHF